MKTVLFDFDGTLTFRDTLRPFAHFLARERGRPAALASFYGAMVLARVRAIGNKRLKERFLTLFVKGENAASVGALVRKFHERHLESLMRPASFDALREHRRRGDRVFIVSANFDFLLEPLAASWGLAGILCTETEKAGGIFTGRIAGEACRGPVKTEKIRALFSPQEIAGMTAYGDREDREMLALVGEGVRVP